MPGNLPFSLAFLPGFTVYNAINYIFAANMKFPVWAIKLAKFLCVGATGACIDLGSTWLLKEKLNLNRYAASSIGFCLGVLNNFFLNRAWTFEGHNSPMWPQFQKFAAVSLVGLGISNLSLYIMHKKFGINFYWSKVFTTVFVVSWNFTANLLFTFKHPLS